MHCIKYLIIAFLFSFFLEACQEEDTVIKNTYKYLKPDYNKIQVEGTTDTLHFLLNDSSYNDIESLNIFEDKGTEFISFFDQRSEALLIYRASGGEMVNRIPLKSILKKKSFYKTDVFVKNYDSIFITNRTSLYLVDSFGHLKASAAFITTPTNAYALLDNSCPPIVVGGKLYTGVKPSIYKERLKTYRNWKVIYEFKLSEDSVKLKYNLPEMYHSHLYGFQYLSNSFCYNNHNRFVFSFAADTNIYETDLDNYNMTYYGKTLYQQAPVKWKNNNANKDEDDKNYLTGEAYGAIYFDPFKRRYLRVAKKRISEANYEAKDRSREQSLIVFDEAFRIIGESPLERNISLSSLLFTRNGDIYARVNKKDEYAIHFLRLEYKERHNQHGLTNK